MSGGGSLLGVLGGLLTGTGCSSTNILLNPSSCNQQAVCCEGNSFVSTPSCIVPDIILLIKHAERVGRLRMHSHQRQFVIFLQRVHGVCHGVLNLKDNPKISRSCYQCYVVCFACTSQRRMNQFTVGGVTQLGCNVSTTSCPPCTSARLKENHPHTQGCRLCLTQPTKAANYARVKSRKGKLRNLTEILLDILFEVFGQLEPVDLLHLSRATKDLRIILITSIFLWKMV